MAQGQHPLFEVDSDGPDYVIFSVYDGGGNLNHFTLRNVDADALGVALRARVRVNRAELKTGA